MKYIKAETIMACLLLLGMFLLSREAAKTVLNMKSLEYSNLIVIDAGHGGSDPGKVAVDQTNEKDINLAIAKKLKVSLEKAGYRIIMTRDQDEGLYDEDASNKKAQDMKRRCALINQVEPIITISIHQNSFGSEAVKGAQVFYYEKSEKGCELAGCIQDMLRAKLDPDNKRKPKPDHSYYLLLNTTSPIVIVECGFLSNWEETRKLQDEIYQDKIVEAITQGVKEYIKRSRQKTSALFSFSGFYTSCSPM